jgi:hypothetical protein
MPILKDIFMANHKIRTQKLYRVRNRKLYMLGDGTELDMQLFLD